MLRAELEKVKAEVRRESLNHCFGFTLFIFYVHRGDATVSGIIIYVQRNLDRVFGRSKR